MAPTSKIKCGTCAKNVPKNSMAILCEGNCQLWYHSKCVGIDEKEYDCIIMLGRKVIWMCDTCRHDSLKVPEVKDTSIETISVEKNNTYCNDTIKILTDQIFHLSENQKGISEQYSILKKDNDNLRQSLNNQADAISEILTYTSDRRLSYAGRLMFHDKNTFSNIDNGLANSKTLTNSNRSNKPNDRPNSPSKPILSVSGDEQVYLDNKDIKNSNQESNEGFQLYKSRRKLREENKIESDRPRPTHNDNWLKFQARPNLGREVDAKKRNQFITGKSTEKHNLTTSDKMRFLFVSRLSARTECEDLKTFLDSCKAGDYMVEKLNSKPELYSSFKVGIPSNYYSDIYSPDFWPENVFVSRFINKVRKTRSTESLNREN
ncbi:hypothetical protein J6590_092019, partial [Homalodisca vitripennis]